MMCRFGLKGKIDVTVAIRERRKQSKAVLTEKVPLELKTGKMSYQQGTIEHRAQVLYSYALQPHNYLCG